MPTLGLDRFYRSATPCLFYPTGWREATEGLSPNRAAETLMTADYLIPYGIGRSAKSACLTPPAHVLYCIKGNILGD